jgi:hypothetical protein
LGRHPPAVAARLRVVGRFAAGCIAMIRLPFSICSRIPLLNPAINPADNILIRIFNDLAIPNGTDSLRKIEPGTGNIQNPTDVSPNRVIGIAVPGGEGNGPTRYGILG